MATKKKAAKKAVKKEKTLWATRDVDSNWGDDTVIITEKKPKFTKNPCETCGGPDGYRELETEPLVDVCSDGFIKATGIELKPNETVEIKLVAVGQAQKL